MENLLEETIRELKINGKSLNDILWCSAHDYYFRPEDFIALANFEYADGYGMRIIDSSLKLVGKDFWLERHEYDGAEWWEFKTMPEKPDQYRKPVKLDVDWDESGGMFGEE